MKRKDGCVSEEGFCVGRLDGLRDDGLDVDGLRDDGLDVVGLRDDGLDVDGFGDMGLDVDGLGDVGNVIVDGFCDVGVDDDGLDDVGCDVGCDVGFCDVGMNVAVSAMVALMAVVLAAVALICAGSTTTPPVESKISICNPSSSKMPSSSRGVRLRLAFERRLASFPPSRRGRGRAELSAAAAVMQAAENSNLIRFLYY